MDKMEEDGGRPVPLQFGQIKHIEEILATKDLNGQSVRVLGKVVEFDIPSNRVVLESPHGRTHRLTVDTRLLEAIPLATHSLFQVIGELRRQEDQPGGYVLEARVARNVDGLDIGLYDEALRLKRQFEAKAQQIG